MGILELNQAKRLASEKNERAGEYFVFASKYIKCSRCGHTPKSFDLYFYKKNNSPLYSAQSDRICVCKNCVEQIFNDYIAECGNDQMLALIKVCAEFNYYFDQEYAANLINSGEMNIGKYIAYVNKCRRQYSFSDNYIELRDKMPLNQDTQLPQFDSTSRWSIEDKKNKDSVVSRLGYDPFADGGHTDEQLRFLYNTFSGYLTDAVEQDPHKLQNVLMMVKTFLQLEIVDRNLDLQLNLAQPDMQAITSLTNTKEKLTKTATSIANENGFAEKTGGKSSQGSNTFSAKQKEMLEKNFSLSKVNIHDIRMSESFKEIARVNAHALIEEMNLTGDDYARLCAEQRTLVTDLQEKNADLEEENRLLLIKVKELESYK